MLMVKKIKKEKQLIKMLLKTYIDVLFNKKVARQNMRRIQSRLHRIGTYDVCNILLSCFYDKRYILDDGINTLAYFHKDTRSQIKLGKADKINKIM